ncbi:ATP-binding protein [Pyrodictium delaneyi]|nr:ATP-binding protein [Pyrodictium delaneyi]
MLPGLTVQDILSKLRQGLSSRGLDHLIYGYGAADAVQARIAFWRGKKLAYLVTVTSEGNKLVIRAAEPGIDNANPEDVLDITPERLQLSYHTRIVAVVERYTGRVKSEGFRGFIDAVYIHPRFIEYMMRYAYDNWISLVNSGITATVAKWTSRIIGNGRYIDMTAEPFGAGTESIYLYSDKGVRVRLSDMGECTATLAAARLAIDHRKPDIILIDGLDTMAPPELYPALIEWFTRLTEKGIQVVATLQDPSHAQQLRRAAERDGINTIAYKLSLSGGQLILSQI